MMESQGGMTAFSGAAIRVLILGGTTEGRELADVLGRDRRFAPIYSLAGRTASPKLPGVETRVGGFGGAEGLAAWLQSQGIAAIVDATHPYAARISANAEIAAESCVLPLLRLQRPAWHAQADDDWRGAADAGAAVRLLGEKPQTVLLAIGRSEVAAFREAPQHRYVIRAVDPPDPEDLPARAEVLLQRGPFALDDERELMRSKGVDVVVSKNSGGNAAYAKIVAARQLSISIIMIDRPQLPAASDCGDVGAALAWLDEVLLRTHGEKPSARGV